LIAKNERPRYALKTWDFHPIRYLMTNLLLLSTTTCTKHRYSSPRRRCC